jgi:hypothetical protein
MSTQLKKIPSNLWVVWVGYNSFQEISYAGKPQVVSSYILSNLWMEQQVFMKYKNKHIEGSSKKVDVALFKTKNNVI